MKSENTPVNTLYEVDNLCARIEKALINAGKNLNALTTDDLFFFDEIHIGGRKETRHLAEKCGLREGMSIVDAGCGVGGPARTLAREFGCKVTGVDLTRSFCKAADMLTKLVNLDEMACFVNADATQMPFASESYDAVWLQHTALNIVDKNLLYSEVYRILKRNGSLIIHEVVSGETGEVHYPVFWAADDSTNFLSTADDLQNCLQSYGFRFDFWEDATEESLGWYRKLKARSSSATKPPLDISVVVDRDVPSKIANLVRNLEDGNIRVVKALAVKAD